MMCRHVSSLLLLLCFLLAGSCLPLLAQSGTPNPAIATLLARYQTRLAQDGVLHQFGRQPSETCAVELSLHQQQALRDATTEFFRDLAAQGHTVQDLMAFKAASKSAHAVAGEGSLFPGQDYWDVNYLATERALMHGRAAVVLKTWESTLVQYFNAHPDQVGLIYGQMDIGSWVTMNLSGLKFEADIDFSTVATCTTGDSPNLELRGLFAQNLGTRTGHSMNTLDTVLTAHEQAGHEVFIGPWGKTFAEMDMLKRSGWKEIRPIVAANGTVTRVDLIPRTAEQLFWERAFRTSNAIDYPKVTLETEPMLSLEMYRHLEHDIVHSQNFSRGDKVIKALKYLERSYFYNKKALAGTDWNPYTMNNPELARVAEEVIKAKNDPVKVADLLDQLSGESLTDATIDQFVNKVMTDAAAAIAKNAEMGISQRLRVIAAMPDTDRQRALDTLWEQMRLEIDHLNQDGQTPPKEVERILDLAMALRAGETSPGYVQALDDMRTLMTHVYNLPQTTIDALLSVDAIAQLHAYCTERLKWTKEQADVFTGRVREKYPNTAAFYDGFVEFNQKVNETANGSHLLQASQLADNAFQVYDAFMGANTRSEGYQAAAVEIGKIGIQEKWPIAGIPIAVYDSFKSGSPMPMAMAVGFYYFPGVGQIYTVSQQLKRLDANLQERELVNSLQGMMQCTRFNADGKITSFVLYSIDGKTVLDEEDITPPGNRPAIAALFNRPGENIYAHSPNFRYWRALIPDEYDHISYGPKLQKLRAIFPHSDEVAYWTVMLEQVKAAPLPNDKFAAQREQILEQMKDRLREAVWYAMADTLELAAQAANDGRVAQWKDKIQELEAELLLADSNLGKEKGLQSRIDREITKATGAAAQFVYGDNIFVVGGIYDKYINAYTRVKACRDDIWRVMDPFAVDGGKLQHTPMKLLLAGSAQQGAPGLTGDPEKDNATAERCLAAHKARAAKIMSDLAEALGRSADPAKDAKHVQALGQLAFEWEHFVDDTPERNGQVVDSDIVVAMAERQHTYRQYLTRIKLERSLKISCPDAITVGALTALTATVDVDDTTRSKLRFVWKIGETPIGNGSTINYTPKLPGMVDVTLTVYGMYGSVEPVMGEVQKRVTVSGKIEVKLTVQGATSATADEAVALTVVPEGDKEILGKLRYIWLEGTTPIGEGLTTSFRAREAMTYRITVQALGTFTDKEAVVVETVHAITVTANTMKRTNVTAALTGAKAEVTAGTVLTISAEKFAADGTPLYFDENNPKALDALWKTFAVRRLTPAQQQELAKSGKPFVPGPRPAGWGVDTIKVLWKAEPAATFTPKETQNTGKTTVKFATDGTYAVWGEIHVKQGENFVSAGTTGTTTVTVGKTELTVSLECSKTVLKGNERADILVTATGGEEPYKYAWSGTGVTGKSGSNKGYFSAKTGGQYPISVEVTDRRGRKGSASVTMTISSITATVTGLPEQVYYGSRHLLDVQVDGLDKLLADRTASPASTAPQVEEMWVLSKVVKDEKREQHRPDEAISVTETSIGYQSKADGQLAVTWTALPAKIKPGERAPITFRCSKTPPVDSRGVDPGLLMSGMDAGLGLGLPDYRAYWIGDPEYRNKSIGATENPTRAASIFSGNVSSGTWNVEFPQGMAGKTFEVPLIAFVVSRADYDSYNITVLRNYIYTYGGAGMAQETPSNYRVIWQSDPDITFDPGTAPGGKANATFDRLGVVKIWGVVQVLNADGAWETVAETDPVTTTVVAPKFAVAFTPPQGEGMVGSEVKASITTEPAVDAALLDYTWINPPFHQRMLVEKNGSVITVIPASEQPITFTATAKGTKASDLLGEVTGSYTAKPYAIKVEVSPVSHLRPQVWKEGVGLVPVEKDSYASDEQVRLQATIDGYSKPAELRWQWQAQDGTTLHSSGLGAEATASRHAVGIGELTVEARDAKGVLIATGSAAFSITVSPDDLQKAKKKKDEQELRVTIVTPRKAVEVGEALQLTAAAKGGNAPYAFIWNGVKTSSGLTGKFVGATVGAQTVSVTVKDAKGKTVSATITIEVANKHVLVVQLSAANTALTVNEAMSIVATIKGGKAPYTLAWSANVAGTGTATQYVAAAPGMEAVTLTVTDSEKRKDSATLPMTVSPLTAKLLLVPDMVPFGSEVTALIQYPQSPVGSKVNNKPLPNCLLRVEPSFVVTGDPVGGLFKFMVNRTGTFKIWGEVTKNGKLLGSTPVKTVTVTAPTATLKFTALSGGRVAVDVFFTPPFSRQVPVSYVWSKPDNVRRSDSNPTNIDFKPSKGPVDVELQVRATMSGETITTVRGQYTGIEDTKKDMQAHVGNAIELARQGQWDDAVTLAERITQTSKKDGDTAKQEIATLMGQAGFNAARTQLQLNEGQTLLERSLKLWSGNSTARDQLKIVRSWQQEWPELQQLPGQMDALAKELRVLTADQLLPRPNALMHGIDSPAAAQVIALRNAVGQRYTQMYKAYDIDYHQQLGVIEKYKQNGNWQAVIDLAEQMLKRELVPVHVTQMGGILEKARAALAQQRQLAEQKAAQRREAEAKARAAAEAQARVDAQARAKADAQARARAQAQATAAAQARAKAEAQAQAKAEAQARAQAQAAKSAAAGPPAGWVKTDLGDCAFYMPREWRSILDETPPPGEGAWGYIINDEPQVALALVREANAQEFLENFTITSKAAITVGGRSATDYRGHNGANGMEGRVIVVDTPDAKGRKFIFVAAARSGKLGQYTATLHTIISLIRFPGSGGGAAPAKPKASGPRQVTATLVNNASQNVHIFIKGDAFGPHNRLTPGASRTITLTVSPGSPAQFYAGRGGTVLATASWNTGTGRPKVVFTSSERLVVSTVQ